LDFIVHGSSFLFCFGFKVKGPKQQTAIRRRENRLGDFRRAAFRLRLRVGSLLQAGLPGSADFRSAVRIRTAIEPAKCGTIRTNRPIRRGPVQSDLQTKIKLMIRIHLRSEATVDRDFADERRLANDERSARSDCARVNRKS
jgi:hypothetical protein